MGITSDALGKRAALQVVSGTLPLWDHFEGLGAPLLGSMQSAALFPPTLLLLLPHGQVIEQTFLQFLAGLGTYLFLRRLDLGTAAALAGGVLFELNGVFAWLRNAAFNPIAFLPWLLFVVESLCERATAPWLTRLPFVGLGALAASLALYAGFPEIVYLYTLLIIAWAAVRLVTMPLVQAVDFAGSLAAAALLALVIAAPLLLAFIHILPESELGSHSGTSLVQGSLSPASLLLYLLPYVFGPIVAAPTPSAAAAWSGVGGFLGLTPVLLAVAGLYCGRRQAICWLMAAYSVTSVGVSLGAPLLLPLFLQLPLVGSTLYYRYMDAGSILCCITLGAIFLDELPGMPSLQWRRVRWIALGAVGAVLCLALYFAIPALAELWRPGLGYRSYGFGSIAIASAILIGFALARSQAALITLAVCEGATAFIIPFASFARAHQLDWPLIRFLQRHANLQRVAVVSKTAVLYPNYGAAFGIASINYDNLPVPARTAAYARTRLDPKADALMFRPTVDMSRGDDELRSVARAHIQEYERASVRYMLSSTDPFGTPAYELLLGPGVPVPLALNEQVTFGFRPPGNDIRDAFLLIGTYGGQSDGSLRARLCQGDRCVEATADLSQAADNHFLSLQFASTFQFAQGNDLKITLRKEGGQHPVALWTHPTPPPASLAKPVLVLVSSDMPRLVLESSTIGVFELPNAKAYASAPGCRATTLSHDRFDLECDAPSRLIRREVWMQGWTARVNGARASVQLEDDAFQAVDVPAGRSSLSFRYEPAGVRSSVWPAFGALLVALALLASGSKTCRAPRPSKSPGETT